MPWNWQRHERQSLESGGNLGTYDVIKKDIAWPNYQAEYLAKRLNLPNGEMAKRDKYAPGLKRTAANENDRLAVYLDKVSSDFRNEANDSLKQEFKSWITGDHTLNNATLSYDRKGAMPKRFAIFPRKENGVQKGYGDELTSWNPTWWGSSQLTHLDGTRKYLKDEFERQKRHEYTMNLMAEFGPQNLEQAWVYFKHWVKGQPVGPDVTLGGTSLTPPHRSLPNSMTFPEGVFSPSATFQPPPSPSQPPPPQPPPPQPPAPASQPDNPQPPPPAPQTAQPPPQTPPQTPPQAPQTPPQSPAFDQEMNDVNAFTSAARRRLQELQDVFATDQASIARTVQLEAELAETASRFRSSFPEANFGTEAEVEWRKEQERTEAALKGEAGIKMVHYKFGELRDPTRPQRQEQVLKVLKEQVLTDENAVKLDGRVVFQERDPVSVGSKRYQYTLNPEGTIRGAPRFDSPGYSKTTLPRAVRVVSRDLDFTANRVRRKREETERTNPDATNQSYGDVLVE